MIVTEKNTFTRVSHSPVFVKDGKEEEEEEGAIGLVV